MISEFTAHTGFDRNDTSPELIDLGGAAALIYSARHPTRATNEDAAAVFANEDEVVLVVADGVGGARAGDRASREVIECLRGSLQGSAEERSGLRERILSGLEKANDSILSLGLGAATTAAVVTVEGDLMRSYHAGDSTILAVGQRGRVKLQTVSHSPVGYLVEAGAIEEDQALYHEDRHLVSNLVGSTDLSIEVGRHTRIASRDTILLATDGLFDNLRVDEILEIIRKGPLTRAGEALAALARERMAGEDQTQPSKFDDVTFVIFRRGTQR